MNFPVNRPSESPLSPGDRSPTVSSQSKSPQQLETDQSNSALTPTPVPSTEAPQADSPRKQPIPPPSHPMQYRAIGLLRGRYQQSSEQLTQGTLIISDDQKINAVLLGRVISVVKNYLDLEQPHLWVVYPRTRQQEGDLHVQVAGVWEPETLKPNQPIADEEPTTAPTPEVPSDSPEAVDSEAEEIPSPRVGGDFSVRGEVIYYSSEEQKVIVKIRQSPRQKSESPKFFKLQLQGTLPSNRALGRFWDLQTQLQGQAFVIQNAKCIGPLPNKKPKQKKNKRGKPPKRRKSAEQSRPIKRGEKSPKKPEPKQNRSATPKPIKRRESSSD